MGCLPKNGDNALITLYNLLFNTKPIIVHGQGKLKTCYMWEPILRLVKKKLRSCGPPDARLEVITWNSGTADEFIKKKEKKLGTFEWSCERVGVKPVVLGRKVG